MNCVIFLNAFEVLFIKNENGVTNVNGFYFLLMVSSFFVFFLYIYNKIKGMNIGYWRWLLPGSLNLSWDYNFS
jgi:hypothetical protein